MQPLTARIQVSLNELREQQGKNPCIVQHHPGHQPDYYIISDSFYATITLTHSSLDATIAQAEPGDALAFLSALKQIHTAYAPAAVTIKNKKNSIIPEYHPLVQEGILEEEQLLKPVRNEYRYHLNKP